MNGLFTAPGLKLHLGLDRAESHESTRSSAILPELCLFRSAF
jgi:hypothetical protein